MINVLVVHEFPLMCDIISAVLNAEKDITVIGCGTNIEQTLEFLKYNKLDVALISSRLPEQGTLKLTHLLVQSGPSPKILILGITETRDNVLHYIEAGAAGYVLRESSLNDLLTEIRAVSNDKALISPDIAAALIHRVSEYSQVFLRAESIPLDSLHLTAREIKVLELLSQNMSNHQIARQLVIEIGTVKHHVHNILHKLGVSSREDAAKLALLIKSRINTQ